jgi:nucleotide sugar dehydrogenase
LRISVIASGVVGKATGRGLERKGHDVIFYDIDSVKLMQLAAEGHKTASSIQDAISKSTVSMICAPSPTRNGTVDLHPLFSICSEIGNALRGSHSYHLVVVRSTIPPGTTRGQVVPIIENASELSSGAQLGVCHNPEFLREKLSLDDFENPRAIVIGEADRMAGDTLQQVYSSFQSPIVRCSLETSEMIKYATNLFNATKISFFNEIDRCCKVVGVESAEVSRVMPFLALGLRDDLKDWGTHGGRAFGGMCLPKDLEAFISFMMSRGTSLPLLSAVKQVNQMMTEKEREAPELIVHG